VKSAGVREARQNLSVLLAEVVKGHEILITDRGRPVARLVAPLPLSAQPFQGHAAFRRAMPALTPPLSITLLGPGEQPGRAVGGWSGDLPGPLYLDATALAGLYFPEALSPRLDRAFKGRRDLTVSDLAVTELLSAVAARPREIAARMATRLHIALLKDLDSGTFRRAEIVPATHRAAERLLLTLSEHALAPREALHLALAMTAGVTGILTFDPRLARAARAIGLTALP